jgi:hypothetical protein
MRVLIRVVATHLLVANLAPRCLVGRVVVTTVELE